MISAILKSLVLMCLLGSLGVEAGVLKDSIGVEKKNGKVYIIHKVDSKETLYSIARKYGVSVDEIKASNDNLGSELKIGQSIFIPSKKLASISNSAKVHTVQAKETLYSIAKKYGISVDNLQKSNPGVNALKVGQTINIPTSGGIVVEKQDKVIEEPTRKTALPETHIVESKETFYSISRKYGISVDELQKCNPDVNELRIGQVLNLKKVNNVVNVTETAAKKDGVANSENKNTNKVAQDKKDYVQIKEPTVTGGPENNIPTYSSLKKDGYTKVNESGIAEMYEDNSGFHYALHKTAPIGTIIYVVNEENGQKVYVRVMGKLTDASPGVIMRISPKAYDKLVGKGTAKIKVTATYIP